MRVVPRLAIVCLRCDELGFRQAHRVWHLSWKGCARRTVGFPGVVKILANSELFARMPISLCNHLSSQRVAPCDGEAADCGCAFSVSFDLGCLCLACRPTPSPASRRRPGRLGLARRNSASRRPRPPPSRRLRPPGGGGRARAASAARALREAQEPRFKLDESGALVPDVRAEAAIIYDSATGQVLWESNSQNQRSIASITKVMTAVVFLENSPDLSRPVVVDRSDVRAASTTYLRAGYTVTKGDLLHLTLIASDNAAARALARVSPYGSAGFIDRMNEKAKELGLTNTQLRGSVGSALDQRVVGLRHGQAHHLCLW